MTQTDVKAEIMRLRAEGLSTRQIAKRVGRSQSSVARTLRRRVEPGAGGAVAAALDRYLEHLDLEGPAAVAAEAARAIAGAIDSCAAAGSTAAAATIPRLAAELVDLLDRIAKMESGRPSREVVGLLREIRG